jgi:hypothetical protein
MSQPVAAPNVAQPAPIARPLPVSTSAALYLLALAAGLALLMWLRLHQPSNTVDDAFITFRYARNLASGLGLVYNAGERVLGTTTPAYAILLAMAARLSGFYDFPRLAVVVNMLFDAISFCLLARLTARLTGWHWLGVAAAWLLAIEGRLLDFSTGGMEGSFNVAAILLSLVLFFEGRPRLAALAAGLVVLIRPDGLMLAGALFAGWGLPRLREPRRWPWAEAAVFAAVVLPWLLFATLFYGQPIPQSVLAKSVVYRLPDLVAFRAFLVQLRTVFPFSLPPLQDPEPLWRQLLQAGLPAAVCAAGLYWLHKRRPRAWLIGAYIALFIAFFSYGNPLWLGWYEIPLMPLYWLLTLAAVAGAGTWLARRLGGPATLWVHGLAGGMLILLALPHLSRLNVLPWESRANAPFVLNATYNKRREDDYLLVARMLAPAAAHGRVAANPEVGAFGYGYAGPVFDLTGLISPAAVRHFPIPEDIPIEIYSVPRSLLLEEQPDVLVTFDSFVQATLPSSDPAFAALYAPSIGMTSHAAFGVQRLMTYRRAGLPLEAALPPSAQAIEVSYANGLVSLAGHSLRHWRDVHGHYLELTLFWRAGRAPVDRELLVRVNLLAADGQLAYQVIDYPGEGLFPTEMWAPDMWLVDRIQLRLPLAGSGPYQAQVTLFASDSDDPLAAYQAAAPLPEDTLTIGPIDAP